MSAHPLVHPPFDLQAHLAAIVDSSDDAIISKDLDGTILSWNAGAERLYGYTADEAIGSPIFLVVPDALHDEVRGFLARVGAGERVDHHDTRRVRRDGREVEVSLTISPVRDIHGDTTGASVIARDVGERKRLERRLVQLAAEDQLTGVANRRAFLRLLDRHVDACTRDGWTGALVLVDLDAFKAINDTLGHGAGDQILKQTTGRLRRLLPDGGVLGRLGGDEFALLAPHATPAVAEGLATAVVEELARQEITIAGRRCATGSVGWTALDEVLTPEEVMIRADLAVYDAKAAGGGCARGYAGVAARVEAGSFDPTLFLDGR